jgi:quercetin dioxygenase-like cupin family protein
MFFIRTVEAMSRIHIEQLQQDPPVIRVPKLVPANQGTAIWWMGDDKITFQTLAEDTDGAYSFWIDEPPATCGPPKHVHSREEEGFYVISGEATFKAGHVAAVLKPGAFIALPAGIPHTWTNTSGEMAKLITFTAPAGNEGFFLALGEPGSGPPGARKTMPVEEINRMTPRYGVTYMETSANPLEGSLVLGAGRSPSLVMPDEGDLRYSAHVAYNIKAYGPVTANTYTLIEIELLPRGVTPYQRHAVYEKGIYVLSGTLTATVEGNKYEVTEGGFLNIPWGLTHSFENSTGESVRLLQLTTPGGIEDFYRAVCRITRHGPSLDMDADLERFRTLGPRFGIFT